MKVNDRVTVKTDGGPRRPGVVLAVEEFSEGTMCTWFRWKTTRSASGSLMKQGIRTVSLLRKQSNLIQPDWWETTSQNVLAHVDKNTISHIIRQSDDMVDNLFIMRFDLTFNITFMR